MAHHVGRGDGTLKTAPWLRWIWLGPAAFLLVFLVIPLATLASHVWDPEGAARLLDGPTWRIAALASVQAALSTVLALAVGLPIAAVVSRYRFRGRAFAQALVTVPFVLPTVVVALAFRSLVGPSAPQGLAIVVCAHAYINLAVIVRIVGARWSQHDDRYETVARTLGASPFRAFVTVTLPMLRTSIASSAGVVFVFCFTSLGIVLILGDSTTRTLESQVLRQTSVLLDFPGAAATAVVQLVLVSVVLAIGYATTRRAQVERPLPPTLRPLPRSTRGRVAVHSVAAATYLLVLTPVMALVLASITRDGGLTLDWWGSLGSIDAGTTRIGSPIAALGTSLAFACIAGTIASLIGAMAAIALITHRVGRITALIAIVPLGVSAATLGLGTLLAFGRPPFDFRATGLLVPLAHSLVAVPLVVAVVAPALRAADPRTQIVAASLGARPTRAFATAYGPILRVVMLAAGGLAAAVSLGEFGAASFLARAGDPTLPIQIVRLLGRPGPQSYGAAASLAVLLVVLTLAIVLVIDRAGRNWRQGPAGLGREGIS
jgi:thiamine transport system permease protein